MLSQRFRAAMAQGAVARVSGVGWAAHYPRRTGDCYDADLRVGLYATEQEAQVECDPRALGGLTRRACIADRHGGNRRFLNCRGPAALAAVPCRAGPPRCRPVAPCLHAPSPSSIPLAAPNTAESCGPAAPEDGHRPGHASGGYAAAPAAAGKRWAAAAAALAGAARLHSCRAWAPPAWSLCQLGPPRARARTQLD